MILGYAETAAGSSPVGWFTHIQLKYSEQRLSFGFKLGLITSVVSLIGSTSKRASLPTVVSEGQTPEVGALRQAGVYGGALQSAATELGGFYPGDPGHCCKRASFFCPWWLCSGSQGLPQISAVTEE